MKLDLYMYDNPIELNEESTIEFIKQYDNAKDTMRQILTMFEDEDTRLAIFYMLSLRTLIDDFLEFCTADIDADILQMLLNDEADEESIFDDEEEDDNEIFVEFDDDEE